MSHYNGVTGTVLPRSVNFEVKLKREGERGMALDEPRGITEVFHAQMERELTGVENAMLAGLAAVEQRLHQEVVDMRNEVIRFQAERESRFAQYIDDLVGVVDLFRNELVLLRREI